MELLARKRARAVAESATIDSSVHDAPTAAPPDGCWPKGFRWDQALLDDPDARSALSRAIFALAFMERASWVPPNSQMSANRRWDFVFVLVLGARRTSTSS